MLFPVLSYRNAGYRYSKYNYSAFRKFTSIIDCTFVVEELVCRNWEFGLEFDPLEFPL